MLTSLNKLTVIGTSERPSSFFHYTLSARLMPEPEWSFCTDNTEKVCAIASCDIDHTTRIVSRGKPWNNKNWQVIWFWHPAQILQTDKRTCLKFWFLQLVWSEKDPQNDDDSHDYCDDQYDDGGEQQQEVRYCLNHKAKRRQLPRLKIENGKAVNHS